MSTKSKRNRRTIYTIVTISLLSITQQTSHELATMAGRYNSQQGGQYNRLSNREDDLPIDSKESTVSSNTARIASVGSSMNPPPRGVAAADTPGSGLSKETRPFSPPSVTISPLRRMAPQRGTTSVPARESPLLGPPPRSYIVHDRAFVSGQIQHLPLYSGRPREEQDRFLEQMGPVPKDITFLPPLNSTPSSNRTSPDKPSFGDIPPPTPPKADVFGQKKGQEPSGANPFKSKAAFGPLLGAKASKGSNKPKKIVVQVSDDEDSASTLYCSTESETTHPKKPASYSSPPAPISIPRPYPGASDTTGHRALPHPNPSPEVFLQIQSPTDFNTPMLPGLDNFGKLKQVEGRLGAQLPCPEPVHPRVEVAPQSPFGVLVPQVSPDKPLPELPWGAVYVRVAQSPAVAIANHRAYRPKTPPPSSFISQSQMNAVCRAAALPELPQLGDESFAKYSLAIKDFRAGPTIESKAAVKEASGPVIFVNWLQYAGNRYTKVAGGAKENKGGILPPFAPFRPAEAKVLVMKLQLGVSPLSDPTILLNTC
jgi:hypothetical protein